MANVSTFSAAMKTKFIGPIRDQMYSDLILMFGLRSKNGEGKSTIPQGTREFRGITADAEGIDFVGNEFRIPLRTTRNSGVGSRAENAVLPAPGAQGFTYISDPMRYHYGLFNITGPLMKASESSEGAFAKALSIEMDGLVVDLKRKVNIDAHGDATGVRASLTATATATNTVTVDTTIFLAIGEVVDVVTTGGPTYKANARTVTAVNPSARTITLSGAAFTAAIGDALVLASVDSTSGTPNNDLNQTINGLANIVKGTGVLHTLNPGAGNGFWASSEINASGAMVGDNLLRQLTDSVGRASGDDGEMVLITSRGIRNRYANQLTALKRFNDAQSTTLRGGFKALLFDDKPLVADDMSQKGTVWALNTKYMFWSEMSDWDWVDQDGQVLKWDSRYDRFTGVLYKYSNLGTTQRNRHGKIYGADDDAE